MLTIRNYTNTKCELEMAKNRLNLLMDRKTELYCKYFPITSKQKEIVVDGGAINKEKMANYLHELNEIDVGIGMSLADEIVFQQENVEKLQNCLNLMNNTLSKLEDIEYQLYYEMVVNGKKITKAVDYVASNNDKDSQTIWKYHYKKIKKDIKKLKKFEKVQ